MRMYMIATVQTCGKRVGFRIFDLDASKTLDVNDNQVLAVLKAGNKIKNLSYTNYGKDAGKIKPGNGAFDRYAAVDSTNGRIIPSGTEYTAQGERRWKCLPLSPITTTMRRRSSICGTRIMHCMKQSVPRIPTFRIS